MGYSRSPVNPGHDGRMRLERIPANSIMSPMKVSRLLFYTLLACNLGLAAMIASPLLGLNPISTQGESERLARQLAPEKIAILPFKEEDKTKAREPAPITAASQSEAATSEPSSGNQSTPVASTSQACVALAGLNADLVRQAQEQAAKLGNAVTTRESGLGAVSYWVNIPPNGGKDGAEKRSETLKQDGIEDYFIVRDPGANQYAISLGLYRAEELAKRRVEALAKKGIKTARISVRDTSGNNARLEITGPNESVSRLANEFAESHKAGGVKSDACRAG